ncbi:MAG: ABC transporter permease [Solirubrobacteraceae bacterium]
MSILPAVTGPPTAGRLAGLRRRSISLRIGVVIVVFFGVIAVISRIWSPYPPDAQATGAFSAPPSGSHLFGTDTTGADIFSRVMSATTTDVGITVAVIVLALVVGTLWGSLIGFYGGWLDGLSLRVLQIMNSFPALLLAMLVLSTFGRGLLPVILVVALIPLPDYVRLARAEILTKKNWQFAEAARMIGRRPRAVLFRHLVPNSLRPLFAYAAVNASWVVSTVGGLGFLGLGIQPGSAEWGSMIAGGQAGIVTGQWWISFFPGIGILLLATALHLIGDGISDDDLVRHGH